MQAMEIQGIPAAPHDHDLTQAPQQNSRKEDAESAETTSKSKEQAKSVRFVQLFSFADGYDVVLMVVGTVGALAHGLALPIFFLFFGNLVDGFGQYFNNPQETGRVVSKYALYMAYLGFVILGTAWAEVACWMHTGQRQASKMRLRYLEAVLNQDIAFFDKEATTGMLVDSISKDILLVQDAISEKVGSFLQFMATFIGGFGVGFSMLWKLCLVTVAVVPAIAFAGGLYAYTLTRLTSRSQEAYAKAGSIVDQTIAQIRTVYSFCGEKRAVQSFVDALATTKKLGYQAGLAKGLGVGVAYSILFFSWALVFWYGGVLVRNGEATGGNAISAIFATIIGGMSLGQALGNLTAFGKGRAAAYNVMEVIKKPIAMDRLDGSKIDEVRGDIDLRNVVFCYPSRPDVTIFQDFSLSIPSGSTIALVGGSGSGKSTVVSLIERFYDPVSGQVLLDGVDIRTLQLNWLRYQIGLVNQEPALFATSILANILYGKEDATMEEVETAAKAANAHAFISDLPEAYDTQVGERGVQLSGGQKQRVAIARAVLKDPKVLLLDEATSALDSASEKVVQDALDRIMVGRTTVVIAHRLSTVRNVDNIAVVQDGKIVEMGSHGDLIARGEAYFTLVKLQEMALASDGTILGPHPLKKSSSLAGASQRMSSHKFRHSNASSSDAYKDGEGDPMHHSQLQPGPKDDHGSSRRRRAAAAAAAGRSKGGYFWRLLKLNQPEWPYALLGSIGAIMAGTVNPIFAYVISEVLKAYYDTDLHRMKREVNKYVLVYVGVGVVTVGIYVLQNYYFGIVGENLTARVREMMFAAMLRNEIGWFDREENGSKMLTARLATDATLVRTTVGDRVSLVLQNLTCFFVACIIGLVIEWRLALVLLATFPLLVASAIAQQLCLTGFAGDVGGAHSTASMIAGDAIGNIRTVAAFNAEAKVAALFTAALAAPAKRSLLRGNISGAFLGASQMTMYCSYGLVLWYGSKLVGNGTSDFGSVMKVFMVLIMTAFAVAETLALTPDIAKGSEALASVFAVTDRVTEIDPEKAERMTDLVAVKGDVELSEVSFAYPTRPQVTVLNGLNLHVKAGASLALVGASGSGKSSVVALVERFYDPTAGTIRVDGTDIRKLRLRELRRHIGLVQQEPALFATSIYENIAYGREGRANAAEVEAAAEVADAHSFVSALPDGYATQVGERGVQLSGGQKQRIAIARAVLKDPAILLLDEATSALDAEAEVVVQAALERVMQRRTTIVVAHRLSTIRHANTIAVLQEGHIVEMGSHDHLLSLSGGAYARLLNLQQQRQHQDENERRFSGAAQL